MDRNLHSVILMATYYLIAGDKIVTEIDTSDGDVTALPLLATGGRAMSLINKAHLTRLMNNQSWTQAELLVALDVVDARGRVFDTLIIAPIGVTDVTGIVPGTYTAIFDVGEYRIWQVQSDRDHLLEIHADLSERHPALGLLAAVETFGSAFYPSAVADATDMTQQEQIDKRDAIASYLANIGESNTNTSAATDEHELVEGIVTDLGHTMNQLWNTMV